MSRDHQEFLTAAMGYYGITYIDAHAIWQATNGDLPAFHRIATDFDPATFYAAHLA